MVAFAEQFDPLEFHTDPEAASESRYGGLIASGYRTLSLSVRLVVEEVRSKRAVIAGLGIDDVRWHEPVRPSETLSVTTTVLDSRPSESDPTTGVVRERISVTNRTETEVLSLENYELVERRNSARWNGLTDVTWLRFTGRVDPATSIHYPRCGIPLQVLAIVPTRTRGLR
ncbi:MaoC/PaaZ C-terminal domain-containing protein [Halosolutus gelatinilyticus]|uniref:MaoC/PaaZ C-terminal domain-containing protein n=1 Tax=Halosolutus gelatinilyticus TaxID=2931975 RepID=UPI001FF282D9|nr:MaoC/PaaZ C-terminal domain-containing protein [Halosolutus gelatinilyticus]